MNIREHWQKFSANWQRVHQQDVVEFRDDACIIEFAEEVAAEQTYQLRAEVIPSLSHSLNRPIGENESIADVIKDLGVEHEKLLIQCCNEVDLLPKLSADAATQFATWLEKQHSSLEPTQELCSLVAQFISEPTTSCLYGDIPSHILDAIAEYRRLVAIPEEKWGGEARSIGLLNSVAYIGEQTTQWLTKIGKIKGEGT